jgi:hypothetical protein
MNQRPNDQSPQNQSAQNQQNQSSKNQSQDKQSGSTSRADQPTPVSAATQAQGSQQSQGTQKGGSSQSTGQQGQMGGDLKQTGKEMVEDAKSAVSSAASDVKSQAGEMGHAVQDQATHFLGEQKGMAADRIGGVADALREAGQQFAEREEGTLAHYTDSLAGQLDNFSTTLRDRDIGSIIDDAKQLAHRQPELFVVGALAAGFFLGRFFKSSRQNFNRWEGSEGYSTSGTNYSDPYGYSTSYGQGFSNEFDGYSEYGRGREYSRDWDAGYRAGSQSGYGSSYDQRGSQRPGQSYGQSGGQDYGQNYGQRSDMSLGERAGEQWRSASAQPQSFGQSSGGQSSRQSSSQSSGQSSGQVTTHGLGTGQSVQREQDMRNASGTGRGQEFGQGSEQVSNYKGNETQTGSQAARKPNEREDEEIR